MTDGQDLTEDAVLLPETIFYRRNGCLVTDRRIEVGDFECRLVRVRGAAARAVCARWWSWLSRARGWSGAAYELVLETGDGRVRVPVGSRRSLAADLATVVNRAVGARAAGTRDGG